MNGSEQSYGRLGDGRDVSIYGLENSNGLSIKAINYGANLVSVRMPDSTGSVGEITLGFDSLKRYEGDHPYFGATIGRYANRIAGGSFVLEGKTHELYRDGAGIHLHGGKEGFDRKLWEADVKYTSDSGEIRFNRISPDGEEGYPGNLQVSVVFRLDESNRLSFIYTAETDKITPINLTNHTYWNLAGPGKSVLDHMLKITGDRYLEIDSDLIPTGKVLEVEGTAFDFRVPKPIGSEIKMAGGYDHCYVLSDAVGKLVDVAVVSDRTSGRSITISTTLPAIQFYTANMLEDTVGRDGVIYRKLGALCLETGGYNSAVTIEGFPSTILSPGETYRQQTVHTFTGF